MPIPQSIEARRSLVADVPAIVDTSQRFAIVLRSAITHDSVPRLIARFQTPAAYMWDPGTVVVFPARPLDVSVDAFVDSIATKVNRLRAAGVPPRRITLIGADDGALVVARVSTRVSDPIGYVYIGGCPEAVRQVTGGTLRGDVLSIMANSDPPGWSCSGLFATSAQLGERAEIRVPTRGARGGPGLTLYTGAGAEGWQDFVSDWILRRRLGPPW
jgi:hypothetical protein